MKLRKRQRKLKYSIVQKISRAGTSRDMSRLETVSRLVFKCLGLVSVLEAEVLVLVSVILSWSWSRLVKYVLKNVLASTYQYPLYLPVFTVITEYLLIRLSVINRQLLP